MFPRFLLLLVWLPIAAVAQTDTTSMYYWLRADTISIDPQQRQIFKTETGFKIVDKYANGQVASTKFAAKLPDFEQVEPMGRVVLHYANGQVREKSFYQDKKLIGTQQWYYRNGQLYKQIKHTLVDKEVTQSVVEALYSPSGQPLLVNGNGWVEEANPQVGYTEKGKYINGLRDSVWVGSYWPSGKHYFQETYQNGKLLQGTSTDTLGKTYTYTEIVEPSMFKGGFGDLNKFLGKRFRASMDLIREGNSRAVVKFTVEADDQLSNFIILPNSSSIDLGKALISHIQASQGRWNSAKLRGQPHDETQYFAMNFVIGQTTITIR